MIAQSNPPRRRVDSTENRESAGNQSSRFAEPIRWALRQQLPIVETGKLGVAIRLAGARKILEQAIK
jgi:hypothetical protein